MILILAISPGSIPPHTRCVAIMFVECPYVSDADWGLQSNAVPLSCRFSSNTQQPLVREVISDLGFTVAKDADKNAMVIWFNGGPPPEVRRSQCSLGASAGHTVPSRTFARWAVGRGAGLA